jgi:hypothetical protein
MLPTELSMTALAQMLVMMDHGPIRNVEVTSLSHEMSMGGRQRRDAAGRLTVSCLTIIIIVVFVTFRVLSMHIPLALAHAAFAASEGTVVA